jgi:hypothetical protein
MGALLLGQDAAKAAFASQQWPGWFSDQQLAYEHAQKLSSALAASVNAGNIAQGWLSTKGLVPRHRRGVPKKRKRKKKRRTSSDGAPASPPAQQQTRRPAPRQYLNGAGVTAAVYAALLATLGALWASAYALGWASAIAVLGVGEVQGAEEALEELIAAGQQRIGWILQTRMSRLQRVLIQALREGWDADRLAQAINEVLASLASALLATQTETTWASGWAAYHAYRVAGVQWVRWRSRRDGLTCKKCLANDYQGPVPLGTAFLSGLKWPPQHPRCRCCLLPSSPPKQGEPQP